jgi:pimeloyl-ACP methyl ester carboxylesterase
MWAPTVVDLEPERMEEIEAFFRSISYSLPIHAYTAHFEADLQHETYERLPSISCPTLVLCGDEDLITLPRYNQTVASRIPGAHFVMVPQGGHFVMLERPDQVNAAIDKFLQSVGAVSG